MSIDTGNAALSVLDELGAMPIDELPSNTTEVWKAGRYEVAVYLRMAKPEEIEAYDWKKEKGRFRLEISLAVENVLEASDDGGCKEAKAVTGMRHQAFVAAHTAEEFKTSKDLARWQPLFRALEEYLPGNPKDTVQIIRMLENPELKAPRLIVTTAKPMAWKSKEDPTKSGFSTTIKKYEQVSSSAEALLGSATAAEY